MRGSLVLLMVACSGGGVSVVDKASTDDGPTDGAPTDDITDDTTDDTGTPPPAVPTALADLDWRLHGSIGAMVYVTWDQDIDGQVVVEYSFDDGEWVQTPTIDGWAGVNEQLIVGIPYSTQGALWRVVAGELVAEGPPIDNAPVPNNLPLGTIVTAEADQWLPQGKFLLTSINQNRGGWTGGTYWTFIIDRKGRPIWARTAPAQAWTLFAQVSQSRDHILWDEQVYWRDFFSEGEDSMVHRTYLDEEIEVVPTPGLHHAFVELPDGTLAWGSQNHGGGEALVERAPGDKDETVIWTCTGNAEVNFGGGCESNGVYYSPVRNSFLYSFYTNSTLAHIDRSTGTTLWWAGNASGGYDFVPAASSFYWQHGVSWTDADTLLVSTEAFGPARTEVREYIVDTKAETLEMIWNYDAGVHADTNGDAWRLANGNTLHLIGSAGHIKEVDAKGQTVWHVDFEAVKLLGRGEFIEDLYTLVGPRSHSAGQ